MFRPCILQKPIAPLLLSIATKSKKVSKDFYKILKHKQEIKTYNKWENILNQEITDPEWRLIYNYCFRTIKDNYLIYLQFKIINRILGTRSLLYKISINDNHYCPFCKEHEETIHLFYECDQINLLGKTLYKWIFNMINVRIIQEKIYNLKTTPKLYKLPIWYNPL